MDKNGHSYANPSLAAARYDELGLASMIDAVLREHGLCLTVESEQEKCFYICFIMLSPTILHMNRDGVLLFEEIYAYPPQTKTQTYQQGYPARRLAQQRSEIDGLVVLRDLQE